MQFYSKLLGLFLNLQIFQVIVISIACLCCYDSFFSSFISWNIVTFQLFTSNKTRTQKEGHFWLKTLF